MWRALRLSASLAESGLGLAYAFEPMALKAIRAGRLERVLERYAPTVPGYLLYFPNRARRSGPLRLFVEAAKEFAVRTMTWVPRGEEGNGRERE